MVVATGNNVTLLPLKLPGIQLYVVAPDASNVVLSPTQMLFCVAALLTFGVELTEMETVAELVQPFTLVPWSEMFTISIVVFVGFTNFSGGFLFRLCFFGL